MINNQGVVFTRNFKMDTGFPTPTTPLVAGSTKQTTPKNGRPKISTQIHVPFCAQKKHIQDMRMLLCFPLLVVLFLTLTHEIETGLNYVPRTDYSHSLTGPHLLQYSTI